MNADKYRLKHHIFFLFFIGINQLALFWIHGIIYATGLFFIPFLNDYRVLYGSLLILLSTSFIVGNVFLYFGHNRFLGKAYHLSAIWLGTMFWLFLAAISAHMFYLVLSDYFPYEVFSNLATTFYVSAFVLSAYGLYNQKNIKIVNIDVGVRNLPEAWVSKKALLFTDSHYGPIHTLTSAWKHAELIRKQNPDILFMSGDFYDGPPTNFVALGEAFKDLDIPLGKYFVAGNHEEYAGYARAIGGVEAGGFIVMDSKIKVVEGVQIVGMPYINHETNAGVGDMLETLGYVPNMPSIVLKHVPIDLESLAKENADLVLCGHTHKGQIWPFSLLAKWVYKGFEYGLNILGDTQIYTSSGIGTWGPPQRIGTQSELVIITFSKK